MRPRAAARVQAAGSGVRPGRRPAPSLGPGGTDQPLVPEGSKVTTVPVWAAWMMVPLPYGVA